VTRTVFRSGSKGIALVRWLLVLGGLILLGWVVYRAGPGRVYRDVLTQGWAIVPYILLSGLENAIHAVSCRKCVSPEHRPALPWWRMFLLYHLAYAINATTPSGNVGGDVARGIAMRRHVPATEAASAVLINKFTFSIARIAVAAALMAMTILTFRLDPAKAWLIGLGSGLTTFGLILFAVVQARGLLGPMLFRMARVAGRKAQEWMRTHGGDLDRRLAAIYRDRRGDLFASMGFDALGFVVAALQRSILIAAVLGVHEMSLGKLLLAGGAVWGITSMIDMIFFFVMAGLGVREGGFGLAFQTIGLPGEKGVAVSIVDRIDQLFWTLFGFLVYWGYLLRPPSKNPPELNLAERTPK
jgi:uncharacterized membrane protein YbhN (UPF0104 family)